MCRSKLNQDGGVQAESPARVSSPSLILALALQSLLTDYNTFHAFCSHPPTDRMLILPQTEPPATRASQPPGTCPELILTVREPLQAGNG